MQLLKECNSAYAETVVKFPLFDVLMGILFGLMEENEEIRSALPFCNTKTTHLFLFRVLEK